MVIKWVTVHSGNGFDVGSAKELCWDILVQFDKYLF